MLGIDFTHLTESFALMQDGAKTVPVMTYLQGVQNGGGAAPADLKVLAADFTAKKFVDYGTHPAGASYDRHLYSNYLGGNPGNQGRNFAGATMVANPFYTAGSAAAPYLLMHALTGKDPADLMKPEIKTSGYISVVAMQNPQATPPPAPGVANTTPGNQGVNASGGGQNAQAQPGDPTPANEMPGTPGTPGSFSSGCSMSSGAEASASGVFFLLLGVAFVTLARRRRA
jgi:MYXO-CTERM domain-containing protein